MGLVELFERRKRRLQEAEEARPTYKRILRKVATEMPNVCIYILCHTEERLEAAEEIYKIYPWAVPILMTYQDCTFENAFWKQLLEIKEEWADCEMVGVMSYRAFKKIDILRVDKIIRDRSRWSSGYFNFYESSKPLKNDHPNLMEIINDVLTTVGLPLPPTSYCNYWMCTPEKMLGFIDWFETKLKPAVLAHPLAMTDAKYRAGKLTAEQCQALFGVSFYPHVPFVFERLNKAFFVSDVVTIKTNVRIYILCYNEERFASASSIYGKYYWAVPILMKYQDCTFENAFWKQLLEIRSEWNECDMVGTLSYSASKKINLNNVDAIIRNKDAWKYGYYNFADSTCAIREDGHPNLLRIVDDVCSTLNMAQPTLAYYNYWMCSPIRMIQFISWVTRRLIPTVLEHPLAMSNADYKEPSISPEECVKKFGVPHYPHVPFVLERLTKAFFSNLLLNRTIPSNPRVIVFSVNLGGYDSRSKKHIAQTYPYDEVFYTSKEDLDISDARNYFEASKKWRFSAHKLNKVKNYDIAIYLDSNVYMMNATFIQDVVDHLSQNKWDMLMSPHEARTTNVEEANECIKCKTRFSDVSLDKYKDQIPSYNRLCWCGFNARWLSSPNSSNCAQLMDKWWEMIKDDPYGVVNDQIEWPVALEYSDIHFPIVFSHAWQKEYLLFKNFNIVLDFRNHYLSRKAKLPLIDDKLVDIVVIFIVCYTDREYSEAQYKFRSFFWAQPIRVNTMDNSYIKQQQPVWASSRYVGFTEYQYFGSVILEKIHHYIVNNLTGEGIQYYYDANNNNTSTLLYNTWKSLNEDCIYNPFWICSSSRMKMVLD